MKLDEEQGIVIGQLVETVKNEVESYLVLESSYCVKGREVEEVLESGEILKKIVKLNRKGKRQCLNSVKTFQLDYIDVLYSSYKKLLKLKHKEELSLLSKQKKHSVNKLQELLSK